MTTATPVKVPLSGPRALLPKDSFEYASTTLEELRFRWAGVKDDERRLVQTLAEVEAARIPERYPPEQPYGDLNALCMAELGVPLADVRRTVAELAVARAERDGVGVRTGEVGNGRSRNNNIIPTERQGTDPTYLARRLLRDAPQDFERLKAGEYPSVYAAAIAAGIAKRRVSIDPTPEGFGRAIRRHLTPEQIGELVALLTEVG